MGIRNKNPRQWMDWVIVATPSILLVVFVVVWLSNWHLDQERYCVIQCDWFVSLNKALNVFPPRVWSNLTLLGDATVLVPLLSPLIIWRAQAWAAILAAAPLASLFSVIGKYYTAVPRPAAFLDQHLFNIIGHALTTKNSFPSGHTITIFAGIVAVLVTLAPQSMNRRYLLGAATAILVALTVSLSRVAVGAHWPLDLLVGGACGSIAGFYGAALTQRYQKWWCLPPASVTMCILGLVLALASLSLFYRGVEKPSLGIVLWLAGLCTMPVSVWLLKDCFKRLIIEKDISRQ